MKPGFALSLSFEGISLLHRAAGGWRRVGEVALDVPDLGAALSDLREKALLIEPGGISCKLIIPNDQIRYLTLETGRAEGEARRALVREALDGATPYAVEDLAHDISVEGHTTHVAAVARETLDEAEAFAVEHRFNPVSFVAVPGDQPFLGEPFFGTAGSAGKTGIEPDGVAVVITGPAVIPEPEAPPPVATGGTPSGENAAEAPAADPSAPTDASTQEPSKPDADQPARPEESTDPAPTADPAPITGPAPPAVGFSSRRGKEGEGPAPALAGASRDDSPAAQKAAPALSRPDRADPAPVPGPDRGVAPAPAAVPPPAPTRSLSATPGPGASARAPSAAAATALLGALRSRATGLLRRSPAKAKAEPLPVGKPAAKQSFTAATPAPEPTPDEAERLTVFGARAAQQSRGKPRHLGLILTIVLLLFLAAVAAWAALFTPEPLARLFAPAEPPARAADPQPETEPAPAGSDTAQDAADPDSPGIETGPAPAQPPMISAVSPPAPSDLAAALPPETATTGTEDAPAHLQAPQSPALTETDSAVLEALRADPTATAPGSPVTEPPGDAARDLAALDPELEPEPEPEVRTGLAVPSLADTETFYATTGIWPTAPETPETPAIIGIDDLYVASIDRTDLSQDAVALPPAQDYVTDVSLSGVTSPAAAGTAFNLDTRGLVTPTPEGAVTPDGITVYLGRPPVVPPPTPARLTPADDAAVEAAALRERLAAFRPRPRPTDLIEQTERAQLGGRSRAELGGLRPRARPPSAQDDVTAPGSGEATPQAVATARIPRARPSDFQSVVRNSDRASIGVSANLAAASPVAATVAPKIPSSASVARQATLKNEINLRQINLIGVYGTASDRRALVRLSSGRYKKVKVGDSIDGGRVVAIGENQLRYQKGGRDHTLKMPRG